MIGWFLLAGLLASQARAWLLLLCVVVILVVLAALFMPWTVARSLLIPRGMPRAARWVASLSTRTWGNDTIGGGLVAAAWAVLRRQRHDPAAPGQTSEHAISATIAWIERERDGQPMLRASHVLATGLLAAARGDLESARLLLTSVTELAPNTTPRTVRALAREWLVADAAARGKWDLAALLAREPRAHSRTLRLLAAVSARLAGWDRASPPWLLWLLWLHAPHRRHTLALVQRAVDTATAAATAQAGADSATDAAADASSSHAGAAPADVDAHQRALRAHVAVLGGDDHERAIEDLAHAWDRALSAPETRRLVNERAAALGARGADAAWRALEDAVARDLADIVRQAGLPLGRCPTQSRVMAEAARLLRETLMNEVELAFDALLRRVTAERRLAAIDEWREWLSLRALHQRAVLVGGMDLRRMVFPHVHQIACKHAVWLWNQRGQHLLANAIFRWLLTEATTVGDSEAIELQQRNWDAEY